MNGIELKGVRTNNLKNIDVQIPLGKITAIVGVSGAGKSSLAFHTLYAEGYLRYIESIAPYIRQFLERVEKPDVDSIEGLPPAIAFRQRRPVKNPRSIVATASDIFDYLRILYAKISDFFCLKCGQPVRKYSIDEMIADILKWDDGIVQVGFEYRGDVSFLLNRGYCFYVSAGKKKPIDQRVRNRTVCVLIDEIQIGSENRGRMYEALDTSVAMGKDTAILFFKGRKKLFPANFYCPVCRIYYDPPDENLFSFNSPAGACAQCRGYGDIMELDPDLIFDRSRSLKQGAVIPLNTPLTQNWRDDVLRQAKKKGIDINRPVSQLEAGQIDYLLNGDDRFTGIKGLFDFIKSKRYKVQARVFLSRFTTYKSCPACQGSRFNSLARSFKIKDLSIGDFLRLTIREAGEFIASLDLNRYSREISSDVLFEISSRLKYLSESGLHYIQLNRPTFTLSSGELQRVNLAFILGSTISDSLLIIDQPSSDLHPVEYSKIEIFLKNLKKNENTIVLVEHNPDIIKQADQVIELGPKSGIHGGQLIFSGPLKQFLKSPQALTPRYFSRPLLLKNTQPDWSQWFHLKNACSHNLKNLSLAFPVGAFTLIVGVSGAGKSTLLYDEIYLKGEKTVGIDEIVFVDPGMGRWRSNSNVAGFLELNTPLREFYAGLKSSQVLEYLPGHFSFNSPLGRCPECRGNGHIEIQMQFLPAVRVSCSRCRGSGFNAEVLKIYYRGQNIADLLNLSLEEFAELMADPIPQIGSTLQRVEDNGMGYLRLGQRLNTLSQGEMQRLTLIKHLNSSVKGRLFLIDEPSYGLHAHDLEMIIKLIRQLVSNQNTVIAVEHNLRLIGSADYLVELGPEGGDRGGYVVFRGNVSEALSNRSSLTGRYLKKFIKGLDKMGISH